MPKVNEVYKCEICGNIVEMLIANAPKVVCCGQEMTLMDEKTEDEGKEKHVPVIEKDGDKIKVKVGSIPHPMEEKHYIQWIEIIADGKVCRKSLNPGDVPEAEFCIKADNITAREYCNIHGHWKSS